MSRLIAIHWNESKARIAAASSEGGAVSVEEISSFDIPAGASLETLKRLFAEHATRKGIKGHDAIVVIDRGQIEMRQLELPPAPDEELPDLVRFQAKSQFSTSGEGSVIDFIRLGQDEPTAAVHVLAATISPSELHHIQEVLELARLRVKHLLPRSFAAVNLIQSVLAPNKYQLLINEFGDEADLTVTFGNRIVLSRTVRLPHETSEQPDLLVREVRRTVAACRNQQKGGAVERILILGEVGRHQAFSESLLAALQLPVDILRTGDYARCTEPARAALAIDDGALGPLLGSLKVGTEPIPHLIDFMLPRRRELPKSDPRKLYWIGGGAAAACALAALIAGIMLWSRASEAGALKRELKSLETKTDGAAALIADVGLIDRWKQGDLNWLDEIHEITSRFPLPDDAIVQSLLAVVRNTPYEANITLSGRVSERRIEDAMATALTERPYVVHVGQSTPINDGSAFQRTFSHQLTVDLNQRKVESVAPAKAETKSDGSDEPDASPTSGGTRGSDAAEAASSETPPG